MNQLDFLRVRWRTNITTPSIALILLDAESVGRLSSMPGSRYECCTNPIQRRDTTDRHFHRSLRRDVLGADLSIGEEDSEGPRDYLRRDCKGAA